MNAIILLATLNLTYLPHTSTNTVNLTYAPQASTNTLNLTYLPKTKTTTINLTYAPKANDNANIPYYQRASYKWNMKKTSR